MIINSAKNSKLKDDANEWELKLRIKGTRTLKKFIPKGEFSHIKYLK